MGKHIDEKSIKKQSRQILIHTNTRTCDTCCACKLGEGIKARASRRSNQSNFFSWKHEHILCCSDHDVSRWNYECTNAIDRSNFSNHARAVVCWGPCQKFPQNLNIYFQFWGLFAKITDMSGRLHSKTILYELVYFFFRGTPWYRSNENIWIRSRSNRWRKVAQKNLGWCRCGRRVVVGARRQDFKAAEWSWIIGVYQLCNLTRWLGSTKYITANGKFHFCASVWPPSCSKFDMKKSSRSESMDAYSGRIVHVPFHCTKREIGPVERVSDSAWHWMSECVRCFGPGIFFQTSHEWFEWHWFSWVVWMTFAFSHTIRSERRVQQSSPWAKTTTSSCEYWTTGFWEIFLHV